MDDQAAVLGVETHVMKTLRAYASAHDRARGLGELHAMKMAGEALKHRSHGKRMARTAGDGSLHARA